jgi:hypothetical protein
MMICGLFRLQARQYFFIQQDGSTNKQLQSVCQRLTVICCVVCPKTMNFKSDNVGSGNFKNYFFQIMLGVVQAISQTNAKPEQLFQVTL